MSDLISRKDAISAISDLLIIRCQGKILPTWNEVYQAMNDVPSAEPEMKWIPVTERLPKTNGCYLVWRPHFFGGKIWMPAICYFDGQNTWHDAYGVDFSRVLHKKDITAWMPLPGPYGGDR